MQRFRSCGNYWIMVITGKKIRTEGNCLVAIPYRRVHGVYESSQCGFIAAGFPPQESVLRDLLVPHGVSSLSDSQDLALSMWGCPALVKMFFAVRSAVCIASFWKTVCEECWKGQRTSVSLKRPYLLKQISAFTLFKVFFSMQVIFLEKFYGNHELCCERKDSHLLVFFHSAYGKSIFGLLRRGICPGTGCLEALV